MADNVSRLFFDVFARDKTKDTFSRITKSTDTLGGKIARFGKLAAGAAAAGLAIFAAQGVRAFLQFDDKMTQSLAIMGEISGPMRVKMENAAREVGKTTRFGADQAAEGYFFLASAGMDAEQSIAALPQVAKFAQAGMFDLARATDLATDAQSALGMSTKDPEQNLRNLTRVTDVLVGANTLANASVEQFSAALTNRAGPALRAVNKPIEEGVAVLAAFADQGIKGEVAGNQLAIVMRDLQTRALANKDAFDKANISVFDSAGNMNNLGDIIGEVEGRLDGMSDAQKRGELAQLGFTDRSISALMALMGMSDQIKQYEQDLKGMAGITDEVANAQLQGFAAKLDLMKSRIADWGLTVGKVLVTTAFDVGATVGEMARMFGELPGPVGTGIAAIAAIAVAAPIVIGAWRKIKSAVDTVRISYMLMGTTARVATVSLGIIGVALAAGSAVLAFFANKNLEANARVEELRASLERQTGAITENTREIAAKRLQDEGALDAAEKLGISLDTVTDAALGNTDAMREVQAAVDDVRDGYGEAVREGAHAVGEWGKQSGAADTLSGSLVGLQDELGQAAREQEQLAAASADGADAQDDFGSSVDDVNDVIDDQVDALDDLMRQLDEMVRSVFAARDAERGWEQAVDDATAALKENGRTLDITTEKGRANQQQLDRLAEAALKDAAATLEDAEAKGILGQGVADATAKMETARAEFIRVSEAMGMSRDEAEKLADELGLIPGNYAANVSAPGARQAAREVGDLARALAHLPSQTSSRVRASIPQGFAKGGLASGLAIVGEEGPEIVRFNRPTHVHPAGETRRLLSGAGGGVGGDGASMPPIDLTLDIGEGITQRIRVQQTRDRRWQARQLTARGTR